LSNLQWHARQALAILNIAEGEQMKKTYVSSYIALRSFEEIIDAYSAKDYTFMTNSQLLLGRRE
jgi:hypothetical protein